MGIGVGIFLLAVGLVLALAVTGEVAGVDIQTVGWILAAVGALAILLSLAFWSSWGGFSRRRDVVEGPTTVVREERY